MAGLGERFNDAGYKDPKPLIKIRGKTMIEYVCDMFDKDYDDFVFIVNIDHYRGGNIQLLLKKTVKNCTILTIPIHKKGPVYSVFTTACEYIKADEPVIVVYCDTPLLWDYNNFLDFVKYKDGVLVNNIGFHPHSYNNTLMAHSKTDSEGRIWEVKEKGFFTNNHLLEPASAGVYYFRYGSYIHKYFNQLIEENINWNGEFYVTLVYNLLIHDQLLIYSYLIDHVLMFGTPCDVKNYEAWQTILEGEQVRNEKDLILFYNYWKDASNYKP